MYSPRRNGRTNLLRGCAIAIAVVAGSCLIVAIVLGLIGQGITTMRNHSGRPGKPTSAAGQRSLQKTPQAKTAALPDFLYPGDPECAITYRQRGNSAMTWTATVTVGGKLITHASDKGGNLYRHVVQVAPGRNLFAAPVSLRQIDDIGGVLYATSTSYSCSVAPYRHKHHGHRQKASRPARTKSSTPVARPTSPVTQPPTPSCYPISDEGTCYEPGEYCRYSDEGTSGIAGDGEPITCEDNDGWRWEPS
jgi:hypothetical protein